MLQNTFDSYSVVALRCSRSSRPAKNWRPIIRLRKRSSSACSTGQLKAGEKMFDLGSGDGRIVIMAAQKYHADATGVELDNDLYIRARRRSASSACRRPPASSTATS
jgi:hypothetical protein